MSGWKLGLDGFVTHFMVSGPQEEPYFNEAKDKNQLRYEAYLRSVIAEHKPVGETGEILVGAKSRLNEEWKYYYDSGSCFVNISTFYSVMRRIHFDIATVLETSSDIDVMVALWSYAAVDVYCNGRLEGALKQPVYKPIQKKELTLHLKAGRNLIYLACENLGVRDTRSVAGLQILNHKDEIKVSIPDEACADAAAVAEAFLESARLESNTLCFDSPAPAGTSYTYRYHEEDFAKAKIPAVWYQAEGKNEILLENGQPYITVKVVLGKLELKRVFERTEQLVPKYALREDGSAFSFEENKELIFRRIADVMSESRGEKFGFPISNILARKHFNDNSMDDERLMYEMLEMIEERYDCSDFLMCGLIRYLHNYPVEGAMKERIKDVMINYRYWMDMDGFDGMCFWSENHALMFYTCAMNAGEMYPDEYFPRAKMTGRELHLYGRNKVLQWLDDVEEYGFEEFLSTVYMCVTFAALINVVDYSEPEISKRAAAVTDKMLSMLALHTYKTGIVAPMGRVYRSVLYPFDQGAMALMNLINPKLPYTFGEGWLGFYASSHYPIPEGLVKLMEDDVETNYTTGNARVYLEKNDDYCLTSVASPREPFTRWENETLKEDVDITTHNFTKSFNERFHGTTYFRPGTYGYQQHMWYAALDGEASIFVTHPGSTSEEGDMRPGYWHGNGVMPALKQQHGLLGGIYVIPDEHPIGYTHLYCPECRFDEVIHEENWIFLRKETGYLALWCSEKLEAHNGMNFNCEQRAYSKNAAYLCVCGGQKSDVSFATFKKRAKETSPSYDKESKTLTAQNFELSYVACKDVTQFL